MARALLILPTATYRASDFLRAAERLGVDVVVASERRQALEGVMGERALLLRLSRPEEAVEAIASVHERTPLHAVVAVDDQGVRVAALAAERLGLQGNPPAAAAATRDKAAMRRAFAEAGVVQPDFLLVPPGADVGAAARGLGFPVVVKPLSLSASRGVIRADDEKGAASAGARARAIAGDEAELMLERYVPGREVALEGLLRGGELQVLALFDKPDPLEGPYFEETILVTPSRLVGETQERARSVAAEAAAALGLSGGPVHAELRVDGEEVVMLELAARSIGGLCSRALRFGLGASLEEVILRHALGMPLDGLWREAAAAGVMMIPIPNAGVLEQVGGQEQARAVAGIEGIEITIPRGRDVVPLPEGDRYLGFLFARGELPDDVEWSLRKAHSKLDIRIADGARAA
ncbi:MAG: ATP-grasp domain-containing protein [Thermoleophilaceae bacterium]